MGADRDSVLYLLSTPTGSSVVSLPDPPRPRLPGRTPGLPDLWSGRGLDVGGSDRHEGPRRLSPEGPVRASTEDFVLSPGRAPPLPWGGDGGLRSDSDVFFWTSAPTSLLHRGCRTSSRRARVGLVLRVPGAGGGRSSPPGADGRGGAGTDTRVEWAARTRRFAERGRVGLRYLVLRWARRQTGPYPLARSGVRGSRVGRVGAPTGLVLPRPAPVRVRCRSGVKARAGRLPLAGGGCRRSG